MIKNINSIVAQSIEKSERILVEFMENILQVDQQDSVTINTMEELLKVMILNFVNLGLEMTGSILSNIVVENIDKHCDCGKKLVLSKHDARTKILSTLGYIPITRDSLFCRRCHHGYGIIDKKIEIYGTHRITKSMAEIITYMAQLMPFEEASETIKKLLGIDISPTQIQIISEEVGKLVFEEDMKKANRAYEKPEEAAPQELPMYRKEGRLYIFTDGSHVNTRQKNEQGSSWREMKLGLMFSDRDMIKTGSDSHIITKKQYVSYFGSVEEFKKFLFTAAAEAGYGKLKEVVVVGDGAPWIWNMCEELFPDAIEILDFFHFSENVHSYAKIVHPENEVARKGWINQVLDYVTNGKVDEAIKFVENSTVAKLDDNIVNLPLYISRNRERIDYKSLKDDCYIIGSGVIESGNKVVIQKRMKQSGMRWSISGGQYIASLRAKYKSKQWNEVVTLINAS